MKMGVLGTGVVGRAIAARLTEIGHEVVIGTREPAATLARRDVDGMSGLSFKAWQEQNPKVQLATFDRASAKADMVINATNGKHSLEALHAAGAVHWNGKVLMDVANPLDFSHGSPPTLLISNADSLGEQIQSAFPGAKVVKTLNTVTASLMVRPGGIAGGEHSIFVSGNDPAAKKAVEKILRSFGWKDIIDLGDISTARGPEMYLPLWLRAWGALGTGMFNISIMR